MVDGSHPMALESVCLKLKGLQSYKCKVLPFPGFFRRTVQVTKYTNLLHSGILPVNFFNTLTTDISSKVACILVLATSVSATELCNGFRWSGFLLAPTGALVVVICFYRPINI